MNQQIFCQCQNLTNFVLHRSTNKRTVKSPRKWAGHFKTGTGFKKQNRKTGKFVLWAKFVSEKFTWSALHWKMWNE